MLVNQIAGRITRQKPTLFSRAFVFAGSFDPFAIHHREIVEQLLILRAQMLSIDSTVPVNIVVWPIGAHATKRQTALAKDRRAMLEEGLKDLDVELRLDDLEHDDFGYTSTYQMQDCLSSQSMDALREVYFVRRRHPVALTEVWHVIGADNVAQIKSWNEGFRLWQNARFIVVARPGYKLSEFPPKSILLETGSSRSSSCTSIRERIANKAPWEHLVPEAVAGYIKEHGLYQPKAKKRSTQ